MDRHLDQPGCFTTIDHGADGTIVTANWPNPGVLLLASLGGTGPSEYPGSSDKLGSRERDTGPLLLRHWMLELLTEKTK